MTISFFHISETSLILICSEEKCKRSQKFAAEVGLPALSNVLLPKTRGFSVCLEVLHNSLDAGNFYEILMKMLKWPHDHNLLNNSFPFYWTRTSLVLTSSSWNAVYDLTIAYKPRCPSFLDNVFGTDPSEVHIHVRRVPLDDIPANEEESSAWLMDSFQLKDKLLSDFNAHGQFPNQRPEEELSVLKCIATFAVVISLTILFIYLTLYSHSFFKVYAGLSGTYLSFATYYKFRPSPSIGCFRGDSCKKAH